MRIITPQSHGGFNREIKMNKELKKEWTEQLKDEFHIWYGKQEPMVYGGVISDWWLEKLVKQQEEFVSKMKLRLKYCELHNGLPYCKNCGLCEEDFTDIKSKLNK